MVDFQAVPPSRFLGPRASGFIKNAKLAHR